MFIRHEALGEVGEVGHLSGLDELMRDPQKVRLVFFLLAVLVLLLGWLHWDFVGAINSVLLLFILYLLLGWSTRPREAPPRKEAPEDEG